MSMAKGGARRTAVLPVLFFGAAFFAGVFFFADAVLLAFCAGRVDREEGVSLAASERVEAAWGRHMQRAFLLFFESFFLIFLFGPVDFFAAGFFFTDAFFFAAGLAFRAASGTSSSAEGAPHAAQHLSTAAAQPHGSAAGQRGAAQPCTFTHRRYCQTSVRPQPRSWLYPSILNTHCCWAHSLVEERALLAPLWPLALLPCHYSTYSWRYTYSRRVDL